MQNIDEIGQPHHVKKLKSAIVHLQKITALSLLVHRRQEYISYMYPKEMIQTFEPPVQVDKNQE